MKLNVLYLRDSRSIYGEGGLCGATDRAAGLDLRACFDADAVAAAPGERVAVPSGIAVEPLPDDGEPPAAGFVYSRSGLGAVKGLCVAQGVGVVDADYRGEIMVWLLNTSKEQRTVLRGERVAQLVFQPVLRLAAVPAEGLSDTGRGSGGFGHTGRQ